MRRFVLTPATEPVREVFVIVAAEQLPQTIIRSARLSRDFFRKWRASFELRRLRSRRPSVRMLPAFGGTHFADAGRAFDGLLHDRAPCRTASSTGVDHTPSFLLHDGR